MQRGILVSLVSLFAVLVGLLVPAYAQIRRDEQATRARGELLELKAKILRYQTDYGGWPGAGSGIWDERTSMVCVLGSDLRELELGSGTDWTDPWGHCYLLFAIAPGDRRSAPRGALALVSPGPNQRLETDGERILAGLSAFDDIVVSVSNRVRTSENRRTMPPPPFSRSR